MSFIDVVFKILSEGYPPSEYQGKGIAAAMIAAALVSVYIFFCYRLTRRRSLYSMSFNLSLLAAAPVTAALILLMSQNAIASIGVVGALAIIRLRGAVKEPMDQVFILWYCCHDSDSDPSGLPADRQRSPHSHCLWASGRRRGYSESLPPDH